MFVKRFVTSRLLELTHIVNFGSTPSNVHKITKHTFLLKRNTSSGLDITRVCENTTNAFGNSEYNSDEDDDFQQFNLYHEVVTEDKKQKIFDEIAGGNPEISKKLKVIDFEISILRDQYCKVPSRLTRGMYEELLNTKSLNSRFRFLQFLFKKEKKRENDFKKRVSKKEVKIKKIEEKINLGEKIYKVGQSSMFMRIYEQTLSRLCQQRQLSAQLFSQTVVFDCSYEAYMNRVRSKNCAQQLLLSYTTNVNHIMPFAVKVCNYDKNSMLRRQLCSLVPNFNEENHPWDFHSEGILDVFKRENIVYLSPHVNNELKEWNHNDVYVIGAFVDKGYNIPASKVKIQQAKLRSAKLPLDSFVHWKMGDKSLPLNTILKILLDMRFYQDWKKAFKNLPLRKIWK